MKELIKTFDLSNQYDILINSYEQIEYAYNNYYDFDSSLISNISNIVICGMGGSAIGGEVLSNLFGNDIRIPIFVNRGYNIPNFTNSNSLVIVSSYSGNTEESISAFLQALANNCKIIAFSTGGKLEELCKVNNVAFIKLKKGYHPRFALYLITFTLIKILEKIKILKDQSSFFNQAIELIKKKGKEYGSENSLSVKLAKEFLGFMPIIYGVYEFNNSLANRIKGQFNENSKLHAFYNLLPEMNHNEIIGWETYQEKDVRFKAIFLMDELVHERIKIRFNVLEKLIINKGVDIIKFNSNEKDFKFRLIDQLYLSDWITYYLAIFRKKDPAEIEYINHLKEELSKIE